MEEFPASKVHVQPNLTYWEVSPQTYVQTLQASSSVVIEQNSDLLCVGGGKGEDRKLGVAKGRNSPLYWKGGRGEGKRGFWQVAHSSYSRHRNPLRHPELSISQQHIPSKDIVFFPTPNQQTFAWRTDILSLALRIHKWQVLSATLGHCYSQYYRCVTELLAD